MLGTDDAAKLPKVAGRAIWRVGNKQMEVQTPYIPDDILEERIALIKEAWEAKEPEKKNFNIMLGAKKKDKRKPLIKTNQNRSYKNGQRNT